MLDAVNSKNVAAATRSGSFYCMSGIPFAPRGGEVAVDSNDASMQTGQFALGTASGCPTGTQAVVFTDNAGQGPSPAGFFVVIYG